MLSHVLGLQTYNSKQPFSLVNGVAVQIYRQASKLTTSPGSLRLHIKITCDYITLQIYMRPAPDSAGSDARPSSWDAPYSLAADAGKSDLCGRVERAWISSKSCNRSLSRYRLGPRDFFFGVMKRRGRSCCFWVCEGRGLRGSSQLSR